MNVLDTMTHIKPFFAPFFSFQYRIDTPDFPDSFPDSAYYNTGKLDICYVVACIAVMAILRDAFRLGVFEPFARWKLTRDLNAKKKRNLSQKSNGVANGNGHVANGNGHSSVNGHSNGETVASHKKELRQLHRSVLRFAEQGWSVVYYTLQWSFGLYLHLNLPTRIFDPTALWQDYPHIPLAGPVKFYYLTQSAFYLHQVLILNAEARRKDHVQMMTHHVITIVLIGISYFSNFTRVGCLIMFLMDWCDIFLPLAKMLRYINYQTTCDLTFAWFLVSWFVTRHFLFVFAIKSTIMDCPVFIPFDWAPERGYYLTQQSHLLFCVLLVSLQILQIIWFWMICRVAWRVVNGSGAADERSDDEVEKDE
ncbi:TLC domain-containing protein [Crucibulum laeve]|uniref:TLC domain-containing protein n=1 Tax=Crucibulum laeve TaxID=68775 RepID=A0A5C3MDV8_9AGAR|nr:TLC domain-containing protein [Crucibulum laeve]